MTTRFHPAPRLRISGAIPPLTLPQHVISLPPSNVSVQLAVTMQRLPSISAPSTASSLSLRFRTALIIRSYVMVASVALVPLFRNCIIKFVCRNSVAGIATRCGLYGPGIEYRWLRCFVPVQTSPGAQSASCTMGTGLFPRVKRSGRGVSHPPHREPRLKKE